jgi:transglutaminase/protease-like cytokinesis protein 3
MASLSESKEFIPLRASQSPIYPDASAWADLDRFATSAPPTNNLHSIVDYLLTRAPRQLSAAESVRVLFAWICQSIKIDKKLGKDCTFERSCYCLFYYFFRPPYPCYSPDKLVLDPSFEQRLSPETVLTEKQANSIAFAKLFAEAARLAGFDCMIIKGRRRYTNYMYPIPTNHVWNAVGIDGQWVRT